MMMMMMMMNAMGADDNDDIEWRSADLHGYFTYLLNENIVYNKLQIINNNQPIN